MKNLENKATNETFKELFEQAITGVVPVNNYVNDLRTVHLVYSLINSFNVHLLHYYTLACLSYSLLGLIDKKECIVRDENAVNKLRKKMAEITESELIGEAHPQFIGAISDTVEHMLDKKYVMDVTEAFADFLILLEDKLGIECTE